MTQCFQVGWVGGSPLDSVQILLPPGRFADYAHACMLQRANNARWPRAALQTRWRPNHLGAGWPVGLSPLHDRHHGRSTANSSLAVSGLLLENNFVAAGRDSREARAFDALSLPPDSPAALPAVPTKPGRWQGPGFPRLLETGEPGLTGLGGLTAIR